MNGGRRLFLGVSRALNAWRRALTDTGVVAFGHTCFFTETPSEAALAFWDGEPGSIGTERTTRSEITSAGWQFIAVRPPTEKAWAADYEPMLARCNMLKQALSLQVHGQAMLLRCDRPPAALAGIKASAIDQA
jgi:hypothetical protein